MSSITELQSIIDTKVALKNAYLKENDLGVLAKLVVSITDFQSLIDTKITLKEDNMDAIVELMVSITDLRETLNTKIAAIKDLQSLTDTKMASLKEDDMGALVELMALIDEQFHYSDTVEEYNTRLRDAVKNNFNKGFLQEKHITSFRTWESNLDKLEEGASRVQIFGCAPEFALSVVGL